MASDENYLAGVARVLDPVSGLYAIAGQKVFPYFSQGGPPTDFVVYVEKRFPVGTPFDVIHATIEAAKNG
jgi:hypothetical protein